MFVEGIMRLLLCDEMSLLIWRLGGDGCAVTGRRPLSHPKRFSRDVDECNHTPWLTAADKRGPRVRRMDELFPAASQLSYEMHEKDERGAPVHQSAITLLTGSAARLDVAQYWLRKRQRNKDSA